MLSIGTNLTTAIEAYSITAVSFLTIEFPDGTMRYTEAPRNITIGGNEFISSNDLAGLSAPDTQNAVDRDNYTVVFNDNNRAMRRNFGGKQGIPLTVQLGFIDDDGYLIRNDDDTEVDLLDVYKGFSSAVNFKPKGDGFVTEVGFTGQLTQLDSTNTVSTTPQSHAKIVPLGTNDTTMQYTHSGVNDDALKWGKKE